MSTARRAYDLLRGYVHREFDRIRDVEADYAQQELNEALDRPAPKSSTFSATPTVPIDRTEQARQILGVTHEADFATIQRAYDRLHRRSEPANFPENSPERAQAAEIQRRIQWAYHALTENVDSTEKRFRTLEI